MTPAQKGRYGCEAAAHSEWRMTGEWADYFTKQKVVVVVFKINRFISKTLHKLSN